MKFTNKEITLEQLDTIQATFGVPKPKRVKKVKVAREKVCRKSPCTKAAYNKWIKDLGFSCADAFLSRDLEGHPTPLEDIVCDSVASMTSFVEPFKDVLWYMEEKLEMDKRYCVEALSDSVHCEAERLLNKKEN